MKFQAIRKTCAPMLVLFVLLVPLRTHAHDLIPHELTVYLNDHPNATPEEIKAYADAQTPEFAQKFRDGAAIVEIVRNQNTTFVDNFVDFFKLGIKHILSGPDHILFVLSLLLVFVSWRDILKLTTTFTIAHSITLVLAGTGILTLTPRIVEPMIALSIAYVAITSVFLKDKDFFGENKGKIAAVFFFGLFHGLGFAGLLKEIKIPSDKFVSSLLAFNLGIEGGQICIVLLAVPFIYAFRNKPWYPKAIKIVAAIIAAVAIIWFIQRVIAGFAG
jgi:hydrogenase/urease accessory protein HupE